MIPSTTHHTATSHSRSRISRQSNSVRVQQVQPPPEEEDLDADGDEDEGDDAEDLTLYCFCNKQSYGDVSKIKLVSSYLRVEWHIADIYSTDDRMWQCYLSLPKGEFGFVFFFPPMFGTRMDNASGGTVFGFLSRLPTPGLRDFMEFSPMPMAKISLFYTFKESMTDITIVVPH